MQGKQVDSGSQDVTLNDEVSTNTAVLRDSSIVPETGEDPKAEQALTDLAGLSGSEDSSGSSSPENSSPRSPNHSGRPTKSTTDTTVSTSRLPRSTNKENTQTTDTTPPKPQVAFHGDLLHLRSQLGPISNAHYESFWAENGPMWNALHNQFRAKELFEILPSNYFQQQHDMALTSDEKVREFREGKIDDLTLFNRAYGLNNSVDNDTDGVESGYLNYNQIIIATAKQLFDPKKSSNTYLEFYRWNALYRLTNELNSFNKTIPAKINNQLDTDIPETAKVPVFKTEHNPYQSISDIYILLENIAAPLTILRTQFEYQDIISSVSSFYQEAQNRMFHYLFFSAHFKRAQILSIIKPMVQLGPIKKLPQEQQSLRKIIEQFENGETNETEFKSQLNDLSNKRHWEALQKKIQEIDSVPDNQLLLADFLEIQLPQNGVSYSDFLAQVKAKSTTQSNLPLYKREVAKQVSRFATGELTHTQFLGQLKIISMNHRPKGFWTRLSHYVGTLIVSLFTLDFTFSAFSSLFNQYNGIYQLDKTVRKTYKETAAKRDADIAALSVSKDVLPVTVQDINRQLDTKVTDILWLNEQEKARCESLSSALTPLTEQNERNSNPHYATALSKLHFIASQKASFQKETQQLETQVKKTVEQHQKIKANKSATAEELEHSKETKKSLVSAITLGLGIQRKARVYSYVAETLAHEPKTMPVVG